MIRNKVLMTELAKNDQVPNQKNLHPDDWDTCQVIKTKETHFDPEKGSCTYEVIIKRNADNRFYRFEYTKYGTNGIEIDDIEATEVFAKEKTIIVYE